MHNFYIKDIVSAVDGILLCGDENVKIENLSTDSNAITKNCLFVPIIGERVDAHKFIYSAIDAGAAAILTSEHDEFNCDIPVIRVNNTVMAMQEIGKAYTKTINIPKIGITGSVGKTTTKEMVSKALMAERKVFKTSGNNNSQIGVPNTLSKMSPDDEIAVIEMGMSMPGEMKRLAELVSLDCAVITNIGVSHIEQLGSKDGICREKFHIEDALKEDGVMLLQGDDPVLTAHAHELKHKVIFFGMNENNDYRAINEKAVSNGYEFDIAVKGRETYHAVLNVPGLHNVKNALAAVAVADYFNLDVNKALKSLADYSGVAMRQQITKSCDVTVIDDSYNASPDSMKAGIDVLETRPVSGKKVAVLADMLELGVDADKYHYEVGEYAAGKNIDMVITYGGLAKNIGQAVKNNSAVEVMSFDTRDEITKYLLDNLNSGDAVLFKGSRGMKLNECVEAFMEGRIKNGSNN